MSALHAHRCTAATYRRLRVRSWLTLLRAPVTWIALLLLVLSLLPLEDALPTRRWGIALVGLLVLGVPLLALRGRSRALARDYGPGCVVRTGFGGTPGRREVVVETAVTSFRAAESDLAAVVVGPLVTRLRDRRRCEVEVPTEAFTTADLAGLREVGATLAGP